MPMTPKPTGGTPAALPEPLVGPDVDLTGFPRFMLDADRLLGSELFALATGEESRSDAMGSSSARSTAPG